MNDLSNIKPIKSIGEIIDDDLKSLNKKPNSKRGGARPGAGMPKGKKTKRTLEKEEAEKEIRRRVINSIGKLINGQLNIAQGAAYLYKIVTKRFGNKVIKQPPQLVKNQSEIEAYLAGEYEGSQDQYYYITTHRPDNKAIEALFDRVFGKAKQAIDLNGNLTFEDIMKKNWEARREAIMKLTDEEFVRNRPTNNNTD